MSASSPKNPVLDPGSSQSADAVPVMPNFNGGRQRLLEAVEKLPLRYAPFWDRLAELWAVPVERVEQVLALSAERRRWQRLWPGFRYFDVAADARSGARSRLLEFAPGFRFPSHAHDGHELVCVLTGSYVDSRGVRVGAGDFQHMEPGSVHSLAVEPRETCLVAVQHPGIRFTGSVLKYLNPWLRAR